MRLIKRNAAGLWTRRAPTDKPGVLWVSEGGDPTAALHPPVLFGNVNDTNTTITARVSNEDCAVWFVLLYVLNDYADFSGTQFGAINLISMKVRACENDTVTFASQNGDGTPFSATITLTNTAWSTLTSSAETAGTEYVLYTVGKAATASLEAQTPFWLIPPPNATFGGGYFPVVDWSVTAPSPVNWSGGYTAANAINATISAPAPWTYTVNGNKTLGLNFCAYETTDVESVVQGSGLSLQTTLAAAYSSVPSTIVAGVPFTFDIQLTSPFDGGAAADWIDVGRYGLSGFQYRTSPSILYDPGTVTNLGGGHYRINNFKIFQTGVFRLKVASRGPNSSGTPGAQFCGFNLRCPTTIEVTPAAPAQVAIAVFPFDADTGIPGVSGELLTGDNKNQAPNFFATDFWGRFRVQGITPTVKTVTDKNGKTFAAVGNYNPITVCTFDAFFNLCTNDNASTIVASLTDLSGGLVPVTFTGTLTQTVVNGFAQFPDLRVHGLGKFEVTFTGPGGGGGADHAFMHLEPLLRVTASAVPDPITPGLTNGVVIVTLTDIDGHVLSPSHPDPITLHDGTLGASGFSAVGTSMTPVAGVAGFTGTFPLFSHGTFNFYVVGNLAHYKDAGAYSNRVSF